MLLLTFLEKPDRAAVKRAICKNEDPPSVCVQAKNLCETQKLTGLAALYNHRPIGLSPPSIAIFSPIFTHFLLLMEEHNDKIHYTPDEIQASLKLMETSSARYKSKLERKSQLEECLRDIHPEICNKTTLPAPGGDIEPDGCVLYALPHFSGTKIPLLILEVENGTGVGGDPSMRAQYFYAKAHGTSKVCSIARFVIRDDL